ncbi:hypothetical protein FKM82_020710 [Ascaphus truei]
MHKRCIILCFFYYFHPVGVFFFLLLTIKVKTGLSQAFYWRRPFHAVFLLFLHTRAHGRRLNRDVIKKINQKKKKLP